MTVVFEPASAIAASLCLTARTLSNGVTTRHPRPCGWCDYSPDELRLMIDGFNAWAGYRERTRTYERHDARVFAELPNGRQAELVVEAQAFPPLPEAAEPIAPPVADADAGPAWFRQEAPDGA